MSVLIMILALNGNPTTVEIKYNQPVEYCKKQIDSVRKEYAFSRLEVVSAKCFSTK